MGCAPKDSISAPPVEGLYDARSSEFVSSPFTAEHVRGKCFFNIYLIIPRFVNHVKFK